MRQREQDWADRAVDDVIYGDASSPTQEFHGLEKIRLSAVLPH